ncbi:two-component system response regulator CreB [Aquabacterium humicola]|uniref:two-component system response regulator CreB n=1 Tax=Aquabacterium humicola TaxID=3237377 RepID=UPI00254357C1|nr:two-component system response regulator CreB [Rubrivivax pictus]
MLPAAPRILLLEDDPAIARTVAFALEREGFAVEQVLLVGAARERLAAAPPALAILDVGLPDGSGLDLCRALRHDADARLARLPILMLTARDEELDRVLGLELGADDYMAKPFSPRELVARVRALLRRASAPAAAADASLFALDVAGQRVHFCGEPLPLTRLEFALLRTLIAAPGRIVPRETLFAAAWGPDSEAGDRTVDTHIKTLRAKLRALRPDLEPIVTHRGMGYELVVR